MMRSSGGSSFVEDLKRSRRTDGFGGGVLPSRIDSDPVEITTIGNVEVVVLEVEVVDVALELVVLVVLVVVVCVVLVLVDLVLDVLVDVVLVDVGGAVV